MPVTEIRRGEAWGVAMLCWSGKVRHWIPFLTHKSWNTDREVQEAAGFLDPKFRQWLGAYRDASLGSVSIW